MARKKILIVDDEQFVTDALEGFFHMRGYTIFKAADGETCLNTIKQETLDLVLLDIKLPKVDGLEVLKLLRAEYPQVKVIVMTAYDLEYKTIVDNIGCEAFFLKPLLIDELTRKVEELLSLPRPAPVAPGEEAAPKHSCAFAPTALPSGATPCARLLIVSPRSLIADLLYDYFCDKEASGGIYAVSRSGLGQISQMEKSHPDIILLDVALVAVLGEFGTTLMKMPQPPKEIILFGDPSVKWAEAESLIRRGTKFIEFPIEANGTALIRDTIQRLDSAVREVCAKYRLFKGGNPNEPEEA